MSVAKVQTKANGQPRYFGAVPLQTHGGTVKWVRRV